MKGFFKSYLFIFVAILLVMSLSSPTTEKVRGTVIAVLAPLWEKTLHVRSWLFAPFQISSSDSKHSERLQLELENQLLKSRLADLSPAPQQQPTVFALPARVIFRPFDAWNSSLWIDVGEANNAAYPKPVIAKNSPVLVGNAIVGVVDYVGKNQSRVRLITDSGLTPAVRTVRGGEQEALIGEHLSFLLDTLQKRQDLLVKIEKPTPFLKELKTIHESLKPDLQSWYLAKGELQGSSGALGRAQSPILKGIGFNYDFPDEEGGARDLRTGTLIDDPNSAPLPLINVNDVLVTTGMDGVFPRGFKIATVKKISPLKEGDYFYELEAEPIVGSLQDLSQVFVIPPLGYDPHDQPAPW